MRPPSLCSQVTFEFPDTGGPSVMARAGAELGAGGERYRDERTVRGIGDAVFLPPAGIGPPSSR